MRRPLGILSSLQKDGNTSEVISMNFVRISISSTRRIRSRRPWDFFYSPRRVVSRMKFGTVRLDIRVKLTFTFYLLWTKKKKERKIPLFHTRLLYTEIYGILSSVFPRPSCNYRPNRWLTISLVRGTKSTFLFLGISRSTFADINETTETSDQWHILRRRASCRSLSRIH